MIIDGHTHNFKIGNKFYNEKDLISSMDEAGIDYSMLFANSATIEGIDTDQVIKICENNPRLKAVGCVRYADFDEIQVKKLLEYLKEGKIYGVKLYPGYENFYPADEKLFKLCEECQKLGKPIIIHTGVLMVDSKGLLKQVHPLNIDELAQRFPELKIIMAHFGNPWIMDAAAVMAKNKNVYTDLSGYFTEYVPISKEERDLFVRQLADFKIFAGGFNKCLFGTDYPLYSQKEYLEAVRSLPMTDEENELVFWKNANEIFDLRV